VSVLNSINKYSCHWRQPRFRHWNLITEVDATFGTNIHVTKSEDDFQERKIKYVRLAWKLARSDQLPLCDQ